MTAKTSRLREIVESPELEFLMEAHNGLSARIAEEAGFKGLWASGLSMSAAMGVRDNNEASWTQVLEVLEFMSEATTIPILVDGDTGYGNFNNVRRLVRKLEQRGVAGVCIEDKLFPKTNSFIRGEAQPLADIDEFCGKIKAAKDTQCDDDFVVIARIEAFIAGWGLSEALRRAEAYCEAGADGLLVHSKKSDATDIKTFMREWGDRHPVVIVPTKYYSTPTDRFRDFGVRMVIWANHSVRASIGAMQRTAARIYEDQSLVNVESGLVPVSEIFRLQGAGELQEAEKKYLPTSGRDVNAVVLAASQGQLGELTEDAPKTLLRVSGRTILSRQVDSFNMVGIKDTTVVAGFNKDKVAETNVKTVVNEEHATTNDLYSLYIARDAIKDATVISYGDVVFRDYVLNDLLNDGNDVTIIVDADWEAGRADRDFVKTAEPYSRRLYGQAVRLITISTRLTEDEIDGEFIGLWKVSGKGVGPVLSTLERLSGRADFKQLCVGDLLNEVNTIHPVSVRFIKGSWLDVNTIMDLQRAGEFLEC